MCYLGLRIKLLREVRDVTQEELAFKLNISQSKLSKIENGSIQTISFSLIEKLCSLFNVNFDYFTKPVYKPEGGGGCKKLICKNFVFFKKNPVLNQKTGFFVLYLLSKVNRLDITPSSQTSSKSQSVAHRLCLQFARHCRKRGKCVLQPSLVLR